MKLTLCGLFLYLENCHLLPLDATAETAEILNHLLMP